MYPAENFHDHPERQHREDHAREHDLASEEKHPSEGQDRGFIRRALERGMSEREIESNLLHAPEFQRLNPDRDLLAYLRKLIDEESGSTHGLDDRDVSALPAASPHRTPEASRQSEVSLAATSEAMARHYISHNFEPSDWLAVVIRNRESGKTTQRIATAEKVASHDFQSWLRYKNAHGSDIYLSLNTFTERARSRTKSDVKEIRHLYLDLDRDGPNKLASIENDSSVPQPNYVLNTSPGKYQVIWKVAELRPDEAEALLRTLAQRFGADPASTDSTRVFRLPGFNNKKYEPNFLVTVRTEASPDRVHRRADFNLDTAMPGRVSVSTQPGSSHRSQGESNNSQSERDWSFALRHLKQGADPQDIIRRITAYRSLNHHNPHNPKHPEAPRKTNPRHYAERTVRRAMAQLGMAAPALPEPQAPTGTSYPGVEHSR